MAVSALDSKTITPEDYKEFCVFLEDSCGIVLGDNKHYLINSRLNRLMKEHGISELTDLIKKLKSNSDPVLKEHTIDAMTTNETSWFRDSYPFDMLKSELFVELVKNGKRSIRIWSAACSSGQEPYSLSMTVDEFQRKNPGMLLDVSIEATDISPSMLAEAAKGEFDSMSISRGLSDERKARYFDQQGSFWKVRDTISNRIKFREINLMKSFDTIGKFDIIFCRNVLIYFSANLKTDILERMARCLNPGGYLLLGGTESVTSYTDRYEQLRLLNGIAYKLK